MVKKNNRKIGTRMGITAIVVSVLFIFMSIFSAVGGVVAGEEIDLTKEIVKETGTTDALGGGDYVFIKFGKDAAFGVIYGTEENPNSIIAVALHTRYLGGADVYDIHGAKMGHRIPIPVVTVYGVKIADMFEFNDTNGDGICDYTKTGDGLGYKYYPWHEPIYKKVSLNTTWIRSEITTNTTAEERTWEFSLTATDLNYTVIGNSSKISPDVGDGKLNKLNFTFHLSARLIEFDNISVPYYNVTVERDVQEYKDLKYHVINSTRVEDRIVSGKRGNYTIKSDHEIVGWDFDPTNEPGNRSLLMESHILVGFWIPETVAEWIELQSFGKLDGTCTATAETTGEGTLSMSESDANAADEELPGKPKKLKDPYIHSGGGWERIGRYTWVTNVTVDGEPKNMYAQVQGHKKIIVQGPEGNWFAGFAVLTGISYPGGDHIYHDPQLSSDILMDLDFSIEGPRLPIGLLLIVGGVVLVVGIASIAYTLKKRGGRKKRKEYFDETLLNHREHRIPGKGGVKEDIKIRDISNEDWEEFY